MAAAKTYRVIILYVTDRAAPPVGSTTWTIPSAVQGAAINVYGAKIPLKER
jgi:hypothetical protein